MKPRKRIFREDIRLNAIGIVISVIALMVGHSFSQGNEDSGRILTIDHYVRVRSLVPSVTGQWTQVYVRERVKAGTVARASNLSNRIVLFVHKASTPSEVAFDVPYQDYSWMAFLAEAGFDVFSMDMTGYGRSTRPAAMDDPCNLTAEQQISFVPNLLTASCTPSYPYQVSTIASE